ncbi:MAG: family 10 glycosylhydrolase [Muribaculaceae bacterium]|nr:family 10 glycosylhydrolase [Muribaculaceae bacterium]
MTRLLTILLLTLSIHGTAIAQYPKREFRGAWLSTVYQSGYAARSSAENQAYLRDQLDRLQAVGINAIIFQVRPSADAFYKSSIEPWSRFLTGTAGKAPSPAWDPLQFMTDECHRRGMEIHAWINPYRITTSAREQLPANHIARTHPQLTVTYAGKLYFNPGLPENRRHILKVIDDIVNRYDIDGIHFDDYFYPYPVKGARFNDDAAFKRYGQGSSIADWRRANVDSLIKEVHLLIESTKPWIRFGISPFGIWRNRSSHPSGSDTSGLQNYDDLYADVILWAQNGWTDYMLPQLYWEYNHPKAAYATLIGWWADNSCGRHLYIGQDVKRTADSRELAVKLRDQRRLQGIHGSCWWPGYSLTDPQYKSLADSLSSDHHDSRALVPAYPWICDDIPNAPENPAFDGHAIRWTAPKHQGKSSDVVKWVVYRFDDPENIDIDDPCAIEAITGDPEFIPRNEGIYTVTALNRVNTESEAAIPIMIIF